MKMNTLLLLVITASGVCTAPSQRRFFVYYEHKSRNEAMDYCREKHTDLATIGSMEDVKTINSMVDTSKLLYFEFSFRVWIGLFDDVRSWKWSLSDPSFYNAGEMEFRLWLTGEPANHKSGKHCTTVDHSGKWTDRECTATYKPVCCSVTGFNVTFFLIGTKMSWISAQTYCREHYTDLASVRNLEENKEIGNLIPWPSEAWIGLSRESWKWMDGSNSSFRYWKWGEPNNFLTGEECVAADFSADGKWEDWTCHWKRAFICHSTVKSKKVIRVSLQKMNPSLDLSDPAVAEDILKQLELMLQDGGLNATLSWRKQPDGNIFHKQETEKEEELGC